MQYTRKSKMKQARQKTALKEPTPVLFSNKKGEERLQGEGHAKEIKTKAKFLVAFPFVGIIQTG